MSAAELAGSPGPHVFVDSLTAPVLEEDDRAHLERSLRMRIGDPLTFSDGGGSWGFGVLQGDGVVEPTSDIFTVAAVKPQVTVAFSLVKGNRPELVVQKLTEIGVDSIVVLAAERSVVKWDDSKVDKAKERWNRIVREASMQSHRVRLPQVEGVIGAVDFLARPDVAIAHFGGARVGGSHNAVAIGPEGGWSERELELANHRVSLGNTVQRAETAAISAGVLLTATRLAGDFDVG